MRTQSPLLSSLTALLLASSAVAAPARLPSKGNPLLARQVRTDPPAVPNVDSPGPPGASGNLRGPASLIGLNPAVSLQLLCRGSRSSLKSFVLQNPIETATTQIPTSEFDLAPGQSEDADLGLYLDATGVKNFQPIRGSTDSPTDPGPRTYQYEQLNPDLYAPPGTDSGSVMNAHWNLGLSHNRHGTPGSSGWAVSSSRFH